MFDENIQIIKKPIRRGDVLAMTGKWFNDLVKAVVDLEQEVMAIDAELHADEERVLLEQGSKQENLWGINLFPTRVDDSWIQFDSMINIRPRQNNRSKGVEDQKIRERIKGVVEKLVVN